MVGGMTRGGGGGGRGEQEAIMGRKVDAGGWRVLEGHGCR